MDGIVQASRWQAVVFVRDPNMVVWGVASE